MRPRVKVCAAAAMVAAAATSAWAGPRFTANTGPGGTYQVYELIYENKTWDEARIGAKTFSFNGIQGNLTSVLNAGEKDFIHAIAPGDWWIGLTDAHVVSTLDNAQMPGTEAGTSTTTGWAWVDGSPYSYQAWGGGEPNDFGAGGVNAGEDAAHKRGDGLWNDHQAGSSLGQNDQRFFYVVKYNTQAASAPISDMLPAPQGGAGFFGVREIHKNGGLGTIGDVILSATTTRDPARDVIDYTAPVINIHDDGGRGNFGNDAQYQAVALGRATDPNPTGDDDVNDILVIANGRIRIPAGQGGVYTFGVNSDDGFRLIVNGQSFSSAHGQGGTTIANGALMFNAGRGTQDSLGQITLAPGDYDIQLQTWEGGGGAAVELFAAKGAHTGFSDQFNLVGAPLQTFRRKAGTVAANGFTVRNFNGTTDLTQALAAVTAFKAGTRTPDATGTSSTVNFADPQGAGANRGGTVAYPNDTAADDNNFATFVTGVLSINEASAYTFDILADDSSFFRILDSSGAPVPLVSTTANGRDSNGDTVNDAFDNNGGCCSDIFGTYNLGVGDYTIEAVTNEQGGGASMVLYGAIGTWTAFGPQFQLIGANIDDTISRQGLELVAVPEPATLGLLAVGALGLLRRRRPA